MNFFKKLFGKKEVPIEPAKPAPKPKTEIKPEDWARLEGMVKPLLLPATKMILEDMERPAENTQLKSHFGGQPYFEEGETWPTTEVGEPLDFVFQVFNTGDINLPEEIKLVQLYYDLEELAFDTADDGWKVKIYTQLNPDKMVLLTKPIEIEDDMEEWEIQEYLNKTPYCEVKFESVQSLPDWEGIDNYCSEASDLSCKMDDDEPWESYQQMVEKLLHTDDHFQSRFGGYPHWVQGDETPKTKSGKKMKLLFQLDSEDKADLMWGDVGLIYIFYDPEDVTHLEYLLQCH